MQYSSLRMILISVLLLSLVALSLSACCKRQIVRVQTQATACVKNPPPLPQGVKFGACEGWDQCLTEEDTKSLIAYIRAVDRWMSDTWLACRKTPEKKEGSQ